MLRSKTIIMGLFFLLISTLAFSAEPVITKFTSHVQVTPNAELLVKEVIKVSDPDGDITHGIYRDFPTHYQLKQGGVHNLTFKLLHTEIDGKDLGYRLEKINNGVRIYLGNENEMLYGGNHTYTIDYEVGDALKFFKTHDELYWNVTGNAWRYPIQSVDAFVSFPKGVGAQVSKVVAYTGVLGARGDAYTFNKLENNLLQFKTNDTLPPGSGLTIAIAWPQGLIAKPGFFSQLISFIQDYITWFISIFGLLFLWLYYYIVWKTAGKIPTVNLVAHERRPPGQFSPAMLGYIENMFFSRHLLPATIVSMAIKGFLCIQQSVNGVLTLKKQKDDTGKLTYEEKALASVLFRKSPAVQITRKYKSLLMEAKKTLKRVVKFKAGSAYFTYNSLYIYIGSAFSCFVLIPVLVVSYSINVIALPFLLFAVYMMAFLLVALLSDLFRKSGGLTVFAQCVLFAVISSVSLVFIIPQIHSGIADIVITVLFNLFVLTNLCALLFLKRPTLEGVKLQKRIDSFKLFLCDIRKNVSKSDEVPEKTPDLFGEYLPYAIALGLEARWTTQFASAFSSPGVSKSLYLHCYNMYYEPDNASHNAVMTNLGGALLVSINQAMSGLSSNFDNAGSSGSSGFSGGGSSGGGFGGGGGGGW